MNQILQLPYHKKNKKNILYFLFSISLFIVFLTLFYFIISRWLENKNSKISDNFSDTYQILSNYSNQTFDPIYYSSLSSTTETKPSVIGKIEISKLNLSYPIFSFTSDDLLKISPCRLSGPFPNQVGNLCIAGHNYDNNKFFSQISLLKANDTIMIYDQNNVSISYEVYKIQEVNSSDLSPLSQDTNGEKEITLITCNNQSKKRVIVKAKEKASD